MKNVRKRRDTEERWSQSQMSIITTQTLSHWPYQHFHLIAVSRHMLHAANEQQPQYKPPITNTQFTLHQDGCLCGSVFPITANNLPFSFELKINNEQTKHTNKVQNWTAEL